MTNKKIWVISIVMLCVAAAVYLFWPIIGLFLIGALIAYVMMPFNRLLQKKFRFPRGLSAAVVMVTLLAAVSALISLLLPIILQQGGALINNMDDYALRVTDIIENIGFYTESWNLPVFLTDYINSLDIPKFLMDKAQEIANMGTIGSIVGGVTGILNSLANLLFVAIVTVYFLFDWDNIIKWFTSKIPPTWDETVKRIVKNTDEFFWKFLKAQVIIALMVSVVSTIGFLIFGVDYAFLLGVITFFFNFIPYFGSIFAGLLVALVALLTDGFFQALYVSIFILVIQQIEGNIIAPKISGSSVNMHPAVILFALLACNLVFGAIGMFIAVPLACLIRLIASEISLFIKKMD